jgi:protein-arginine deiminase
MKFKKIKTKIFSIGCVIVLGIVFQLLFSRNTGNTSTDLQMVCEVPVFLFNNDSDQNTGEPDHSDQIINGPNDLLDSTPIIIRQKPGLSFSGKCCVSISEPARKYVQLFYKSGENYVYIENKEKQELPIDLLRDADIELRIEANSYACADWDGTAVVSALVEDSGKTFSGSVRLKVAPFILLSAVQKALKIYVRDFPGKNGKLIRALKELTPKIGVELKIIGTDHYDAWNIWLQDVMEVGYSRTPSRVLHVVLNANRGKSLDAMPKQKILGPDHGWFKWSEFKPGTGAGRGGDSWLDWYGNLEVTPPLPGKPFGRILYGYNQNTGRSLNPQIVKMLEAQGVQTPLIKIHTGWLLIKHVDEIFNFIPAKEGKGFKILVPDVTVTYRLLEQWQAEGKGELTLFRDFKENVSVSSLIKNQSLREFNSHLQVNEIEADIKTIEQETGVPDDHIIRIPALFEKRREYASAMMPNMVNSAYMNGHILMADPEGPVFAGEDLIQKYVRQLLSKEDVMVHFIDDLPYHKWGGNVHCATNVTYQPYETAWWE